MQVSNTNQPVTLPIQPKEPTYSNKDIYEASQGNVVRNNDDELGLTPQGELNVTNKQDVNAQAAAQEEQAQKDARRGVGVDYLATNSKKSQVEIYLAAATDGNYSSDDSTANVIETLRDVQKQNNTVNAYASYKENQSQVNPLLS